MKPAPHILVFAGSAREASYNKKLARLSADAVTAAGGKATFIDLRDLPLPLFDEDLEAREGEPSNAKTFKAHLKACDGFIIASPEHNSSYSALLKNAIDWASRRREGEARLACFSGKVAAIMSASPGQLGGLRGLANLRVLLSNLGVIVLPDQVTVPAAHQAFQADGSFKDPGLKENVDKFAEAMVRFAGKLG
jgi:NAD(P)H-dependent FMN reductase